MAARAGAELLGVRFMAEWAAEGLLAVRFRARCACCTEVLFTLATAVCNGHVLLGARASIESDGEELLGVGFRVGFLRTEPQAKVLAFASILNAEQSWRLQQIKEHQQTNLRCL